MNSKLLHAINTINTFLNVVKRSIKISFVRYLASIKINSLSAENKKLIKDLLKAKT